MDIRRAWKVTWPWLVDITVMVLAAWLMFGCTTKRVVTDNRRAVHDTVYVSHGLKDSVRVTTALRDSVVTRYRDSVVIVRDTAGKIVERYEWHYGNNERQKTLDNSKVQVRTDTLVVYRNKTDTAYVTRTITAQPVRKHNWLVAVLMVLVLMAAAGALIKLWK